jgi:hypothetical protein
MGALLSRHGAASRVSLELSLPELIQNEPRPKMLRAELCVDKNKTWMGCWSVIVDSTSKGLQI